MGGSLLQAAGLAALDGVEHAFETRSGNLLDVLPGPLLRLHQIHGADVQFVGSSTDLAAQAAKEIGQRHQGDALVTDRPTVTLAVATADCLPVLIADPARHGVAAAHAGWRGLALGVLPATLAVLAREVGSDVRNCVAAIGPRVGRDVYRVSDDVAMAFRAAGIHEGVFSKPEEQPHEGGTRTTWLCDLVAAARLQLVGCGVRERHIEVLEACTVRDAERFHSWRRDGEAAGRMLAGIALV